MSEKVCETCDGSGVILVRRFNPDFGGAFDEDTCDDCKGTGRKPEGKSNA